MNSLKSLQLGGKGHKKSYSTDTLGSNGKRKFISVVSKTSRRNENRQEVQMQLKNVAELKEVAMGIRKHQRRESKGITLRIKQPSSVLQQQQNHPERGVKQRMKAFKQRLSNLQDPSQTQPSVSATPLQTPINRLLSDSACKENY